MTIHVFYCGKCLKKFSHVNADVRTPMKDPRCPFCQGVDDLVLIHRETWTGKGDE